MNDRNKIPRSPEDDYSQDIIDQRQSFIEAQTGVTLDHTKQFSFCLLYTSPSPRD